MNDIQTITELLKKTTEISKNNGSVEEFAAYVISNFELQPITLKLSQTEPEVITPEIARANLSKEDRNFLREIEVENRYNRMIKAAAPKQYKPVPQIFLDETSETIEMTEEEIRNISTNKQLELEFINILTKPKFSFDPKIVYMEEQSNTGINKDIVSGGSENQNGEVMWNKPSGETDIINGLNNIFETVSKKPAIKKTIKAKKIKVVKKPKKANK